MSIEAEVRPTEVVTAEAARLLIREARRRQRQRRLIVTAALVILATTGWLTARTIGADGTRPVAPPQSSGNPVHPTGAADRFGGTWHFHTTSVTIQADGRGSVTWPGPLAPGESEATAVPGTAEIRLTSVNGDRATAMVTDSTEASVLPNGPAQLQVSSQDLLYLVPNGPSTHSPFGRNGLCGPRAAALTVAQQVAAGINCGA